MALPVGAAGTSPSVLQPGLPASEPVTFSPATIDRIHTSGTRFSALRVAYGEEALAELDRLRSGTALNRHPVVAAAGAMAYNNVLTQMASGSSIGFSDEQMKSALQGAAYIAAQGYDSGIGQHSYGSRIDFKADAHFVLNLAAISDPTGQKGFARTAMADLAYTVVQKFPLRSRAKVFDDLASIVDEHSNVSDWPNAVKKSLGVAASALKAGAASVRKQGLMNRAKDGAARIRNAARRR